MTAYPQNEFMPDYAIPPGEILEETLEARGIKKSDFAEFCGLSVKTVSQIIHGKAPVSPETAIQFERVLGVSAAVWNNLEAAYRLHEAQETIKEALQRQVAWAERFPIRELVKRGLIDKPTSGVDAVERLLKFFAVGSIEAWSKYWGSLVVNFRKSPSFRSNTESVAAWLRIGELIAEEIETMPYDKGAFIAALREIRSLTSAVPAAFKPRMTELCSRSGVALAFVAELPKTHLSGATRWLNKDKALIMLSLRHKTDDHFWFSFFHEAAHILLHGKKMLFLDEANHGIAADEKEADRWASNFLIPKRDYAAFVEKGSFRESAIQHFARLIGLTPGIVVGRLQHDTHVSHKWLNDLKCRFEIREDGSMLLRKG